MWKRTSIYCIVFYFYSVGRFPHLGTTYPGFYFHKFQRCTLASVHTGLKRSFCLLSIRTLLHDSLPSAERFFEADSSDCQESRVLGYFECSGVSTSSRRPLKPASSLFHFLCIRSIFILVLAVFTVRLDNSPLKEDSKRWELLVMPCLPLLEGQVQVTQPICDSQEPPWGHWTLRAKDLPENDALWRSESRLLGQSSVLTLECWFRIHIQGRWSWFQ